MRNQYHLQRKEEGSNPQPGPASAPQNKTRKRLRVWIPLLLLFLMIYGWSFWSMAIQPDPRRTDPTVDPRSENQLTTPDTPGPGYKTDGRTPDWWNPTDPDSPGEKQKAKKPIPPDGKSLPETHPGNRFPHNNWRNPDLTKEPSPSAPALPLSDQPEPGDSPAPLSPDEQVPDRVMQFSVRFPYWQAEGAMKRLKTEAGRMDEINYPWFDIRNDGSLGLRHPTGPAGKKIRTLAEEHGIRILPVVGSQYSPTLLHRVMNHPDARKRLIESIVTLVEEQDYDGVELQFQPLLEKDREAFNRFAEDLSSLLHENGRWLSIAVHPKTSAKSKHQLQRAQDWERLGKAADSVKIMAFHYSWEQPGPSAPLPWLEQILTYAKSTLPPQKIHLCLPAHGYIWSGKNRLAPLTYREAQRLISGYGLKINRDESGEAWFRIRQGAHTWTGYYPDAAGYHTKLAYLIQNHPDIAGVTHWYLGVEDPKFWQVLREVSSGHSN
ncbi:glycosyl hydrolase family 18 (putative chitinase) [Melghirimyces profundicolus]|uniref:Glycosyl hydrolase family 18 (Putative chitinase) n=1 Tax=Melghirimyces profundicolus TaxID=1242148 RepID=A0A2T6ASF3_9BACL|nr:glycosyl hydrolase family 18 protein [Melghirimyces profundicolus]PTX46745.1 glycosyl hydrolase family 18 (putative chitinase) [Melghirimyces profundicolus]